MSILVRVKQVYWALTAKVYPDELLSIDQYLEPAEKELFLKMSIVDQRHALDASYLVIEQLKSEQKLTSNSELVKAALLHDIGKMAGDLTLIDRINIVLLRGLAPGVIPKIARAGQGGIIQNRRHALYIAQNHGKIGADLLKKIDSTEELIFLVRDHHLPATNWKMQVLQEADSKT